MPGFQECAWGWDRDRVEKRCRPRPSIAGPNGRTWALLADQRDLYADYLTAIGTALLGGEREPLGFNEKNLYFLHKKPSLGPQGWSFAAGDFRDLSVGHCESRIVEWELVQPVGEHLSTLLHPCNVGWVPGRQIAEPIQTTHDWLYTSDGQGAAILVDFFKAFPCCLLAAVWAVLVARGWDGRYVRALATLHRRMDQTIHLAGSVHAGPRKRDGLWTGSCASPTLLLLVLDVLAWAVAYWANKEAWEVDMAAFADDFAFLIRSMLAIRPLRDILALFGEWTGIKVSIPKSNIVVYPSADLSAWQEQWEDGPKLWWREGPWESRSG